MFSAELSDTEIEGNAEGKREIKSFRVSSINLTELRFIDVLSCRGRVLSIGFIVILPGIELFNTFHEIEL